MRFMPLRHRSFQPMLLILSLYMVHAHYNELDAIYAFNSQPSQCLYYVIIRIIGAGVSLFKILLLINGWYFIQLIAVSLYALTSIN